MYNILKTSIQNTWEKNTIVKINLLEELSENEKDKLENIFSSWDKNLISLKEEINNISNEEDYWTIKVHYLFTEFISDSNWKLLSIINHVWEED